MTVAPLIAEAPEFGITPPSRFSAPKECELRCVDPTVDSAWDRLVISHPASTTFHSSAWMRVLRETYGHKPFGLTWSSKGEVRALVPLLEVASLLTGRRGVCLPFTDFCQPLCFGEFNPALVVTALRDLAQERGWRTFETRGEFCHRFPVRPSVMFHGHSLDLRAGATTLFESFASSVRRAIRKAQRSGLRVDVSTSEKAMRDFYRLHIHTRRRHGLPPQPFSFFRNIHDHIIKSGAGFVTIARRGFRPVAAAVFFCCGSTAVYKFGASDYRYQDLRANNWVMWHAVEHLAETNVETLHLGRTSPENEGLRHFKLGWGATEKPINYFRFDVRSDRWISATDRASGMHNVFFKRLPLFANRLVGAAIYPHLD